MIIDTLPCSNNETIENDEKGNWWFHIALIYKWGNFSIYKSHKSKEDGFDLNSICCCIIDISVYSDIKGYQYCKKQFTK